MRLATWGEVAYAITAPTRPKAAYIPNHNIGKPAMKHCPNQTSLTTAVIPKSGCKTNNKTTIDSDYNALTNNLESFFNFSYPQFFPDYQIIKIGENKFNIEMPVARLSVFDIEFDLENKYEVVRDLYKKNNSHIFIIR